MILANRDKIRLIGYEESTLVQEAKFFIKKEFSGPVSSVTPEIFLQDQDLEGYSYIIAFTLDRQLRKKIISIINEKKLDCGIYIHDTVTCYFDRTENDVRRNIGIGTFVAPYSSLLWGSTIGNHCIIETYCLISHHTHVGNNTQLHSGVMLAGRTSVGNDCTFNFKSSALNSLSICDGVEVGASSCVTKNLTQPGKYVGTPARRTGDIEPFIATNQ
jgi:acetyltransferase-like isoleucine patch superfamily enzyme